MRVIGTAGHVDHGKSTLVQRLTGIDPDRLAEEKAREMTIDLGFAWLALPDGEMVGIVDVPGHRDFIGNMLAGIGGIDAVLLVIAADEGIMPQTREHLAIIDLLGISNGLIVLTKIDTIDDKDWLDLVESEIRATCQHTTLASAELVRVSAVTGEGVDQLVVKLSRLLAQLPPHLDRHQPRLPIDRVFTLTGFGTVVTGTLMGGSLSVGDEVVIHPAGLSARIRGLQAYKTQVERAFPGSRTAVNLAGVNKQALSRGQVLTHPNRWISTALVDVHYRHLPDATHALKHNSQVKVYAGAAEVMARVRLLSHDTLSPGQEGWLQLQLASPILLAQGDRYILRIPSPGQTIGGGVVVDPHPARKWKRMQAPILEQLAVRLNGTSEEQLAQAAVEPMKRDDLQRQSGYTSDEFERALKVGLEQELLIELGDDLLLSAQTARQLYERMEAELRSFHQAQPLRVGIQREELRSRLRIKNSTMQALIARQNHICTSGNQVYLATHEIRFTPAQHRSIDLLLEAMNTAPFSPPSFAEAATIVSEEVLYALIELERLVQVQPEIIFTRTAYETLVAAVIEMIESQGAITAGMLRDRFDTSRKYAIAVLEHLDALGVTKRNGDMRVRGTRASR